MRLDEVIADLEHIQQIRVTSELHKEAVRYLKQAVQWHYISKELPKESGFYLVTCDPHFEGGHRFVCMCGYDTWGESWHDSRGYLEHHVVAWMPLPTPAEADNE